MPLCVGTVATAADRPQDVHIVQRWEAGGALHLHRPHPPNLREGEVTLYTHFTGGKTEAPKGKETCPVLWLELVRSEPLPYHTPCLDCPIPLCFRPQPVGADDASQPRGCGEERPSPEAGWETGDAVGRRDRSRLPAHYRIVPGSWAPFTLCFSQNPLFFTLLCLSPPLSQGEEKRL